MPLGSFYVLTEDGFTTLVEGVASETRENVPYYDGTNYRDELDSSFLGNSHITVLQAASTGYNAGVGAVAVALRGADSASPDTLFEQSDSYTHTVPRNELRQRTRFCWWSGTTFQMEGTTTLNSTTLTVASTTNLRVGMRVSGDGIPDDTFILAILGATTVTMSYAASEAGTAIYSFQVGTTFQDSTVDTTINDATATMANTGALLVGMNISGVGIPSGTTVLSITNATTFEMSANATANGTNITATFVVGNLVGYCWVDELVATSPNNFTFQA